MKTIIKNTLALLTIIVLATTACKKNDTGGKAEVHALIMNNATPINAATVYVKFNATQQPSNPTSDYDLKAEGEATENHVHIEDLRPGQYYLYAIGLNTTTNKVVHGGAAVEIKWKDRKATTEVDIAVTE